MYKWISSKSISHLLSNARARLEESQLIVETKIISGEADDVLCDYLSESSSDVLAMGAFGHGILHEFFVGSLTSKMIHKSKRPILLLR
jgi:nucleotide-binding universal stress UspA family protein